MTQQLVIDISGKAPANTNGEATIVFYKKNPWEAACQLSKGSSYHEGHFGCRLSSISGSGHLAVDTVEHAKKIIEALQVAISEGWLFTAEQLDQHHTSVTDTRQTISNRVALLADDK